MCLTVLRTITPAGDPAAVGLGEGLGGGGQADRLGQGGKGGRPGLLQLHEGDVVVKRGSVVVLMHHDAPDLCYVPGAALRQHAYVDAPLAQFGQPGRVRGQRSGTTHPDM